MATKIRLSEQIEFSISYDMRFEINPQCLRLQLLVCMTRSSHFFPDNINTKGERLLLLVMKLTTWKIQAGAGLTFCFFTSLLFPITSYRHEIRAYKDGDVMLGGLFNVHRTGNDHDCGELNPRGLGSVEAMIFAIESVNKNPNLLPNVTIGYDIRDYCGSMSVAMKIAFDFVSHSKANSFATILKSKPISALIGPVQSASAVLVGSLLQVNNIPAVSPSATSRELSSRFYKDFFRTIPSDKWQATAMADIIEHFNWTYVAVVGMEGSYGRSGISALEKESFNRKSFCIAFSEFIPTVGYEQKINQTLAKIERQPRIGVIIVWLSGRHGEAFFQEVTNASLKEKTFIVSDALVVHPRFITLNGSLAIKPRDYPYSAFKDHLKTITPAKEIENETEWWDEFWRSQLNCSAKQSTDYDVNACNENMTYAVSKLHSSFHSYLIDAVFALAHALDTLYNCSALNGAQATNSCPSAKPTVKGSDLTKYLRNVSFNGLTGKVQFDSSGNSLSASYDIVNLQRGPSTDMGFIEVKVGVWNKDTTRKLQINDSKIRWNSHLASASGPMSFCSFECLPGTRKDIKTQCCWDCIDCPQGTISTELGSRNCTECDSEAKPNRRRNKCEKLPIINITFSSATGISITVVASVGFILTLIVCASYIKFYNTPIVKSSSREVSVLLLFGIAALFGLSVVELGEPSDFLCSAANVWRYIALTVCIAVLFLKLMRITGVFELDKVAQLLKPCFKTAKRQCISISLINSAAFLLIALWMAFDPPGRQKIVRSDEYIFLVCKPFDTNTGFSLFITLCAYILAVGLLCTYYAFKARGIPENFNETKYIAFSMYILLLSSLSYYPVVFNFESWYVALVSCLTTLITSFGLLSCMFGPKVYVLLFRPQQNTLEAVRSQVSQYSFHVSGTAVLPASIDVGRCNYAMKAVG